MAENLYPIFPYKKVKQGSRCFFYGGGLVGKSLLKQITKNNYCKFIGFIDQNADEHKQDGVLYIYPDEITEYDYDYIVITVLKNRGICEKVRQLGIAEDKIIVLDRTDYYTEAECKEVFDNVEIGNYCLPSYLQLKDINLMEDTLSGFLDLHPVMFCMGQMISLNETFEDVLVKSFQYKTSEFWLMDDNGAFLGAVDIESDDIDLAKYKKGILIKDMIAHADMGRVYLEDTLENVLKSISKIKVSDIAVLDSNDKLVKVMNRLSFLNLIADVRADENELLIDNRFCGKKQDKIPGLAQFAHSVYSQDGEDGIIEEIFNRIGFRSKYAVEFGGWDGVYLSNIRNLILEHGFSALYIEGEEETAADGKKNYEPFSERVTFVTGFVQHRRGKLLDDFLKENNAPKDIDLLSIDIDGYDYHVWKSLSCYRPRCVVIEYNPTIPNHLLVVPPLREDRKTGASARALVELGMGKGYSLAAVTDCNLIFVINEEYGKLGIENLSLNVLRLKNTHVENNWFMTYEGEIYNGGPGDKYIWQGEEKFASNRFAVIRP